MLILTPKDIKYCTSSDQCFSGYEAYPNLSYRGFLFVRIASFSHKQIQKAIQKSRQFLEQNEPVTAIILKEIDCITLWAEAGQLSYTNSPYFCYT